MQKVCSGQILFRKKPRSPLTREGGVWYNKTLNNESWRQGDTPCERMDIMADLNRARAEIDRIDREMAKLWEDRMTAVREVGAYKIENGLPVLNADREEQIVHRNAEYINDAEFVPGYVAFIRRVMEISRDYQTELMRGMRVGYSGVQGAFAEIAAEQVFPNCTLVPYGDFSLAYRGCENGEVACCILPVENSTAGEVGAVTDLMFAGRLYISGMYQLRVSQNLLALPGTRLSEIKTVLSHPQALSQCAAYIKKHDFQSVSVVNTALAAKQVAEQGDRSVAAIASRKTAKLYGLELLERNIQESAGNTTRFAVFTCNKPTGVSGSDAVSAFLFTVKNEAGALARTIGIIGRHGFNLRCLRSRPMKTLAWQYYFYAEVDGNLESDEGAQMLAELGASCDCLKVAGIFCETEIG